jgi:hypothetical protein
MGNFEAMKVTNTGERMVYSVSSERIADKAYRVDLVAMGGASQCGCADWTMRRAAAIARGEPIGTRATMCKHVLHARRHFTNELLRRMAKESEGGI